MIVNDIEKYIPFNEEEMMDKKVILDFIKDNPDYLERTNLIGHLTASCWIVNKTKTKVLFCYHNIYNSWSWCGGHADGEENLKAVAIKEAKEETGLTNLKLVNDEILSLECLHVAGHYKNGKYVNSHLHFNITYLLEGDENEPLKIKEDENSNLKWFDIRDVLIQPQEKWMVDHVYKKILSKLIMEEKE